MRANEIRAALATLVGDLGDAGVAASVDPRGLNPPCAWVTLEQIDASLLCGDITASAVVLLIAPDNGMVTAIDTLTDMLDGVLEAGLPVDPLIRPDTANIGVGAPLPALRLTIPIGD